MYQQFGLRITKVNKYEFIFCASVSAKSSASSALLRGWSKSLVENRRKKGEQFPFSGWRSCYTIDARSQPLDSHKLNLHKFHIPNMLFVFLPDFAAIDYADRMMIEKPPIAAYHTGHKFI